MRLALAIATTLAIFAIPAGLLVRAAWRRAKATDDAAHDLPHGDVVRVPVGATPRPLSNPLHGRER